LENEFWEEDDSGGREGRDWRTGQEESATGCVWEQVMRWHGTRKTHFQLCAKAAPSGKNEKKEKVVTISLMGKSNWED